MASGRPGGVAAHSQFFPHQRPGGSFGARLEPPTPCGVYNLLGQPTSAAMESPTVVSDVAASSASPSSRQQVMPAEFAAGMRVAAAANAAGHSYAELAQMQLQEQTHQQQQQQWQQQSRQQWGMPGQQQQQHESRWSMYPHEYSAAACSNVDGWVAVEAPAPLYVGARQHANAGERSPTQQQQRQVTSLVNDSDPFQSADAAARFNIVNSLEGWQQQVTSRSSAADGNGDGAFESVQRGLPPLRVGRPSLSADADGAHSAPAAGAGSFLRQPTQWMADAQKEVPLRTAGNAAGHMANSSAYSSYQHSPNFAQQMPTLNSSPADDKRRAALLAGAVQSGTAAAVIGKQDPVSAAQSPTAALSQQMVSVLAVDSPMHSPVHRATVTHQQYQQTGSGQVHEAYSQQQQQQHFKQEYNQGTYIPRTDDLISDPLMDMLMDQALGGSVCGRMLPPQRQRQTPHVSIMEATLQHDAVLKQQQHQQEMPQQQHSQQQQAAVQLQQPVSAGCPMYTSHYMAPPAAAGIIHQPRYTSNYLRMMDMLQHMPLVSDPGRRAWEDQVRQLKSTLAPHESEEFSAYVRALWQSRESSTSSPGSAAMPTGAGGVSSVSAARLSGPVMGGKHRHGPSRLSAAASPGMDAAAAADTPPTCGMVAGASASSVPMLPVMLSTGHGQEATGFGSAEQVAGPSSNTAIEFSIVVPGTVSAGPPGLESPDRKSRIFNTSARTAQQLEQGAEGVSTSIAGHVVSTLGPEHTATAPPPVASGVLNVLAARSLQCSSPLKRGPSSLGGSSAGVLDRAMVGAMSPLKRTCRDMPGLPSFAMSTQAVACEIDGGAWTITSASSGISGAAGQCSSDGSLEKLGSTAIFNSDALLPGRPNIAGGFAAVQPAHPGPEQDVIGGPDASATADGVFANDVRGTTHAALAMASSDAL